MSSSGRARSRSLSRGLNTRCSASTMPREIDSWIVKTSSVVPEYLCAQSAESLAMSISFVVTRSDDPLRRTQPASRLARRLHPLFQGFSQQPQDERIGVNRDVRVLRAGRSRILGANRV